VLPKRGSISPSHRIVHHDGTSNLPPFLSFTSFALFGEQVLITIDERKVPKVSPILCLQMKGVLLLQVQVVGLVSCAKRNGPSVCEYVARQVIKA